MSFLYEDKKDKENIVNHLELEISSLDKNNMLIVKEKKYLENLVIK